MVRQHTAALRTAQDGVVQAAQDAAQGYGHSLEHLPQGVAVVDAQLRLRAWNRRYVELFRLPPELARAGRPIGDILRHNARRGLLGEGDTEEAIRRRLEHLQAARPYVFERERPDGTVLEIRGNPLPGGGFVTSYADITAYKSAARDLRTLADTLERRVAQRTAELQEARREAERANRSKTRFVAAAVHAVVRSDEALLRRILQNFLSNAVRYTRGGRVLLGCRRVGGPGTLPATVGAAGAAEPATGGTAADAPSLASNSGRKTEPLAGWLRIEVWDSGPGIPEHQRQEIFEEFRRLDGNGDQQGAGLGLAIVDRTARLLGHAVGLRSWPGRGSVFSLTVPLGQAGAAAPEAAPAPPPAEDSAL
ncbi:MAG: PAS-domain containing protein, partial [Lysobacter sp.]|nr:PAS-domain containing protein [Lysobacter sp.]